MIDRIKIVSLKTRGLRDNNKRRELFFFLKKQNVDIAILQECHSMVEDMPMWQNEWGGPMYGSHHERNSRGVLVLIKPKSSVLVSKCITDSDGRQVMLQLEVNNSKVTLAGLYAPNNDDPKFFLDLMDRVEKFNSEYLLLVGDFNLTLDDHLDRQRKYKKELCTNLNPKALRKCQDICDQWDLIDAWRLKNPEVRRCSWHWKNVASRIDLALVDQGLFNRIAAIDYECGYKTDHSKISIVIDLSSSKRGPGYWKFNARLLKDVDYVKSINDIIEQTEAKYINATPDTLWEIMQVELITFTSEYAKEKAHQ